MWQNWNMEHHHPCALFSCRKKIKCGFSTQLHNILTAELCWWSGGWAYGQEFDSTALLPVHYCIHSGSKSSHQCKNARIPDMCQFCTVEGGGKVLSVFISVNMTQSGRGQDDILKQNLTFAVFSCLILGGSLKDNIWRRDKNSSMSLLNPLQCKHRAHPCRNRHITESVNFLTSCSLQSCAVCVWHEYVVVCVYAVTTRRGGECWLTGIFPYNHRCFLGSEENTLLICCDWGWCRWVSLAIKDNKPVAMRTWLQRCPPPPHHHCSPPISTPHAQM